MDGTGETERGRRGAATLLSVEKLFTPDFCLTQDLLDVPVLLFCRRLQKKLPTWTTTKTGRTLPTSLGRAPSTSTISAPRIRRLQRRTIKSL